MSSSSVTPADATMAMVVVVTLGFIIYHFNIYLTSTQGLWDFGLWGFDLLHSLTPSK